MSNQPNTSPQFISVDVAGRKGGPSSDGIVVDPTLWGTLHLAAEVVGRPEDSRPSWYGSLFYKVHDEVSLSATVKGGPNDTGPFRHSIVFYGYTLEAALTEFVASIETHGGMV